MDETLSRVQFKFDYKQEIHFENVMKVTSSCRIQSTITRSSSDKRANILNKKKKKKRSIAQGFVRRNLTRVDYTL
jgi:hypothetical protein